MNRRRPSRETPLGPGAKKDGCFRRLHWSEQTKVQNTEKGMYVGLKQPCGDRERYVTAA